MSTVPLAIACVPLALYLVRLGMLNLRRRPAVVSGALDAAWLAFGITGLVIIGPLNLFLPDAATQRFGPYVWLLVLGFYSLSVMLYLLVARPRLVVFNIQPEKLRGVLDEVIHRLDSQAQVAGDAIHAPQLAVQLHLDVAPTMRNISLVATGDQQSQSGWTRLAAGAEKIAARSRNAAQSKGIHISHRRHSAGRLADCATVANAPQHRGSAVARHASHVNFHRPAPK